MRKRPLSVKSLRWLADVFRSASPKDAKQFTMQADAAERRKENRKGKSR